MRKLNISFGKEINVSWKSCTSIDEMQMNNEHLQNGK